MSDKPAPSVLQKLLISHLRDPIRLRYAVSGAMLLSWYFGYYVPTTEQMASTEQMTASEHRRAAVARQIESLRESLEPFQEQVPANSGQNELIQYVIAQVRRSPVKLLDLRPAKTKDLGAFDNIGLHLQLETTYEDLDALLTWVETDRRMLRIESLKIESLKDKERLKVDLGIQSLCEKARIPGAAKPPAA